MPRSLSAHKFRASWRPTPFTLTHSAVLEGADPKFKARVIVFHHLNS